jgi:hypothetical protein
MKLPAGRYTSSIPTRFLTVAPAFGDGRAGEAAPRLAGAGLPETGGGADAVLLPPRLPAARRRAISAKFPLG